MDLTLLRNLCQDAKLAYPNEPIMQKLVVVQGVHESGFLGKSGGSQLALRYNNLFGIKGSGNAGRVLLPTWEEVNGKAEHVNDYFAAYKGHYDCFLAHKALMDKPRYKAVREATTIQDAFYQLWKCDYATDSKYAEKLLAVMEQIETRMTL